jgi:hypothetical protein
VVGGDHSRPTSRCISWINQPPALMDTVMKMMIKTKVFMIRFPNVDIKKPKEAEASLGKAGKKVDTDRDQLFEGSGL